MQPDASKTVDQGEAFTGHILERSAARSQPAQPRIMIRSDGEMGTHICLGTLNNFPSGSRHPRREGQHERSSLWAPFARSLVTSDQIDMALEARYACVAKHGCFEWRCKNDRLICPNQYM